MHQRFGVGDGSAEGGADGLMAQAHPQNWDPAPQCGHRLHGDPRLLRPPRPGGKNDMIGGKRPNFPGCHLIIADHTDVRFDLTDELVEIVGKAVVVVDQ